MESSKITFTKRYEISAELGKGVEIGFFADTVSDECTSKVSYVRVENNEADGFHGILCLDFDRKILRFGYDVLIIERPFEIVKKNDKLCRLRISVLGKNITISVKQKE